MNFGDEAYRRLSELARVSPREALGEIALSEGLITVEQLDACLREQRESPEPRPAIGEILVRRGLVTSEKLRYLLERQAEEEGLHDPLWRYEVRSLIARGGMASVFRAWDRRLRREVALKAVRSELAHHPEIARRILHEARAVANLHHPNIVAIHDVCERGGSICLVMDLIDGRTLDAAFSGPPDRRPDPCDLLAKAAEAVHYAHTQDVIHRDLKPANLMVDAAGEPHILDFGLARATGIDSVQTRAGAVIGTPPYMAPEQVRGDSDAVGPRTDVYSLGAILYEALTGKPPHTGISIEEVSRSVLNREPTPPRDLNPEVPAPLQAVAMKALNKVPADRYATAKEFAEDLRRFRRGEAVRARAVPWALRALRGIRGRPLLYGAVLVVTAVNLFLTVNAMKNLPDSASPDAGAGDRLLRIRIEAQTVKYEVRSGRLDLADARRWVDRLRQELRTSGMPEYLRTNAGYVESCLSLAVGQNADAEQTLRLVAEGTGGSRQPRELLAIVLADRYFTRILSDPGDDVLAEMKRWLTESTKGRRDDYFDSFEDQLNREVAEVLRVRWIEGDRDRAAALLQDRLLKFRAAELLNMLARCQPEKGAAIEAHSKALAEAPRYREALMERGRARFLAGDWANAAADFTEVLNFAPEEAVAWANRGLAKHAGGDATGAAKDLGRALEIDASLRRHLDPGMLPPEK